MSAVLYALVLLRYFFPLRRLYSAFFFCDDKVILLKNCAVIKTWLTASENSGAMVCVEIVHAMKIAKFYALSLNALNVPRIRR